MSRWLGPVRIFVAHIIVFAPDPDSHEDLWNPYITSLESHTRPTGVPNCSWLRSVS